MRFGGRNISTLEVESVVRQHPDVKDVAALVFRRRKWKARDELKINIILAAGSTATHEDIAAFINRNGPYYFVPRYMEFVTRTTLHPQPEGAEIPVARPGRERGYVGPEKLRLPDQQIGVLA